MATGLVVITLQHLPAVSVDSPSAAVEPSSSDVVINVEFLLKFKLVLKSLFVVLLSNYSKAESVAPTLTFVMLEHIVTSPRHTLTANWFSSSDPCTIAPDTNCLISSPESNPVANVQPTITKKRKKINKHLQIVPLKESEYDSKKKEQH